MVFGSVINVSAAQYEDVEDWDGHIEFASSSMYVHMNANAIHYTDTDTGLSAKKASVSYSGRSSNILRITDCTPQSVIDGKLIVYGTIVPTYMSYGDENHGYVQISFDADNENNITFGGYVREFVEIDGRCHTKFAIEVQFNEYYCTTDFINIPFTVYMTQGVNYNNVDPNYIETLRSGIFVYENYATDWAGDMSVYTNMQSNPSMDGYFADQNQTIIDQSQAQIDNQVIQNQLQEEQNQLQENANELQAESNEQNKNFMDNFFTNLGNTVLHWIVPTADQLSNFLSTVTDWTMEKFGVLALPLQLAEAVISCFIESSPTTSIVLPAFRFDLNGTSYNIWNQTTLSFDYLFNSVFKDILHTVTNIVMTCSLVNLAIKKWDSMIGGRHT